MTSNETSDSSFDEIEFADTDTMEIPVEFRKDIKAPLDQFLKHIDTVLANPPIIFVQDSQVTINPVKK